MPVNQRHLSQLSQDWISLTRREASYPVCFLLEQHKLFMHTVAPPMQPTTSLSKKEKEDILKAFRRSAKICREDFEYATFIKQFPPKAVETTYRGKTYKINFDQVLPKIPSIKPEPSQFLSASLKSPMIVSFKISRERRDAISIFTSCTDYCWIDSIEIGLSREAEMPRLMETMIYASICKYVELNRYLPAQIIISMNFMFAGVENGLQCSIQRLYPSKRRATIWIMLDVDDDYVDQCQRSHTLLVIPPPNAAQRWTFQEFYSSTGRFAPIVKDQLIKFYKRGAEEMQQINSKVTSSKFFQLDPADLASSSQSIQDYQRQTQIENQNALNQRIFLAQIWQTNLYQAEEQNRIKSKSKRKP